MRALWFLILASALLFGASIDKKIASKKRALSKTESQISGLNRKLSKLAKNIKALKKELDTLQRKIASLDRVVKELSKEQKERLAQMEAVKKEIEALRSKHKRLKEELILAISNSFSKSLLLASMGEEGEKDLLKEEILKAMQKKEDMRLASISKEYKDTLRKLQEDEEKLKRLEAKLEELMRKKSELKALKLAKAKKLKSLNAQKMSYDKELQNLVQQREALRKTLAKLQILKERQSSKSAKVKVKKYGGYKKDKTVRYTGPKTIPPLKRFIITKKYGVYRDPIYKIEIPNENIELKPLEPNAKVRNVLNGKIILAKWTPHLKNVVIVKHSGNLYTIYANIDQLSPYVKKGRRIRKGYVLGRVNSKLIFEVTKNSAHINPLDLIRVR
jgi:septal ring factor EnvC (AmiA/AmiB activator)